MHANEKWLTKIYFFSSDLNVAGLKKNQSVFSSRPLVRVMPPAEDWF